jgi:hypothetical protein
MARLYRDSPVKPAGPALGCTGAFIIGLLLAILFLGIIFTAMR